ncbi:MAG: ATP-binding protein [Candidatus Anammoxibacter sp.]
MKNGLDYFSFVCKIANMITRTIAIWALNEDFLNQRMSFIAGPRQIGKTTMVKSFLKDISQGNNYFNWDTISLKQKFAQNPLFFKEEAPPVQKGKRNWIVFDEIHKYPNWKNLLKGYFDEFKDDFQFVITGSARLDLFRMSGDSLIGRYFLYKMFPLGLKDLISKKYDFTKQWNPGLPLKNIPETNSDYSNTVENLINTSGFPEPFLNGTKDFYQRWKEAHISLLINEDLRDLTRIIQIKKLETLIFLLPERIGSPLSLNSLSKILECSYGSIKIWLEAFEKVFLTFSLPPYSQRLSRAVVKEKKHYFWDWGIIDDPGIRFENFIAVQLLRSVSSWNEWGKGKYELFYIRTKDGLEIDFAITCNNKLLMLVEAKVSDAEPSKSFKNIKNKLGNPLSFQIVKSKGFYKNTQTDIIVIGVDRFLQILP